MTLEVKVPEMGESIVEATVGKWLKQVGETVSVDEPIVELETDKVNVEVSASQPGVLEKILKAEGETVTVSDILGTITDSAAADPQPDLSNEESTIKEEPASEGDSERITPVARRIAAEHGVDAGEITASGAGGKITKEDVMRYLQESTTEPPAKIEEQSTTTSIPGTTSRRPAEREHRVTLTRYQQTMAARLTEAVQTAAMTTTFNEVDMSGIIEIRQRMRDTFKDRHGVALGFMSFFTKAVVEALKTFPVLNSEIQGDELVFKHYYDIGVAISTEDSLVVPVVRDADQKSFAEIESSILDLATRARERKLTIQELQGGTFTITNGGVFGSLMSTPLLNPPQVGILGMHGFKPRPVVIDGQVVVRPMMYLALTYDHRIVDGKSAVSCLVRIKELVEDPSRLLIGT
ncbi:MAG: 2-oxoglutarate dehydrogenase E2 component (dihydrolipoamide succinyltransferase) [Chloroflexi bacterium]|jgi:2-oxoglutarate dehydrogenase E2 component (dihydrolipoamide succinyltransferase)|nr:MAG: 2-oxoglutarate dehydrogenase E2 component (dihydrolipoamide succinyltransferase) [Chloroflexota bacterium]